MKKWRTMTLSGAVLSAALLSTQAMAATSKTVSNKAASKTAGSALSSKSNAGTITFGLIGGWYTPTDGMSGYAAIENSGEGDGKYISTANINPSANLNAGFDLTYTRNTWGVMLEGMNINNTSKASMTQLDSIAPVRASNHRGAGIGLADEADGQITYKDQNIAAALSAQTFSRGRFSITPYLGLAYDSFSDEHAIHYGGKSLGGGFQPNLSDITINNQSQFHGAGPMLGTNLAFNLGAGISMVATAEYRALMGNTKASEKETHIYAREPGKENNAWRTSTETKNNVVSNINTALALDYTYVAGRIPVGLSLGYSTNSYLDIVQEVRTSNNGGPESSTVTSSNANNYGPFLKLHIGFNL